jgi:triacylglycerol esterase/lipase EstA (alpha/beta hydrolase family)
VLLSIVAVHGLGAHPEFTWTTKHKQAQPPAELCDTSHASIKDRVNWLKDEGFLKEDFKTARIMTFGYNADWFLGAPMATAEQRAGTLLRELKRKREGLEVCSSLLRDQSIDNVQGLRPILFIGHSFGGIVIKHVLSDIVHITNYSDSFVGNLPGRD